jgi:hypothetical protein
MRSIHSNWRFNKAGQGCFYNGQIEYYKEKYFNFVYDCGTVSKREHLRSEIKKLHGFQNPRLNILTISHLDADHVNLVGELLGPIHCDTVILPYLSRLERLFVLFKHEEAEEEGDYLEFLSNPVLYVFKYNVKRVILIQGDNEDRSENNVPDLPNDDNPEDPVRIQFADIPTGQLTIEQEELRTDPRVRICKDKGRFFVTRCWEFYYYNKRQDDAVVNKFREWLENRFYITIGNAGLSKDQFELVMNDLERVKRLRKQFKDVFESHNSTGLTVMHSPFYSTSFELTIKRNKKHSREWIDAFEYELINKEMRCPTLLNADTNLHDINYPNYIVSNLPYIRVFQVPHHGSKNNWSVEGIRSLSFCQLVINFGWGNRFGHPGYQVLDDIKRRDAWEKRNNTQLKSFEYSIFLYWTTS